MTGIRLPHSDTGLYGSEDGRRACAQHVPYPGSDTWRAERWSAIGWSEYLDAFRFYPDMAERMMACEACGFTPRRVVADPLDVPFTGRNEHSACERCGQDAHGARLCVPCRSGEPLASHAARGALRGGGAGVTMKGRTCKVCGIKVRHVASHAKATCTQCCGGCGGRIRPWSFHGSTP